MKHRVCTLAELSEGSMKSFDIDGEPVLVANIKGELYAIHDICSHAMAYLSEGELLAEECQVQCPDHAAIFDLKTGDALALPAVAAVDTYKVSTESDDIYVETGE